MTKRICVALVWMLVLASGFAQQSSVIKEIVVQGNQNVRTDAILLALRTKVGQPYVQSTLDQDKRTLEEMGFFSAVDIRAIPLDAQNFQVLINVSEFPMIKEIRIVGNTVVTTDEILKAITLAPGQVFNLKSETSTVQAIRELYTKKGYFAAVDDIGPMEASPGTVNISIKELTVNSISVQGNTRTKDRVMRRLIKTKSGDAFNSRKWEADLRRIYGTQWFENVDPDLKETDEPDKIDLLINVKEGRTGQFNVGLQLDPRSSLAGLLRLSDTNFRGTGQTVGIDFLQATRGGGASIDLDYTNPWIDDRDTSLSVALYSRLIYRFTGSTFGGSENPSEDEDDRYYERRSGATVGFSRPFGDRLSAFISGRFENITTKDLETTDQNSFIKQNGDVGVLAIGAVRNRRDVDVDPSRGDWMRISLEPGYSNIRETGGVGSNEAILGANTFFRTQFEYRAYFSPQPPRGLELDAPRKVLAFRLRAGSIMGEVPFFEQFFTGGSDTLRGYPEDRFWGRTQIMTTLEYRHPIQRSFNMIAFVDYGGAWGGYQTEATNRFQQSKAFKMHLGYGLGLSFKTPLGPIRLDFGFNENGGSRTHFLIGTSF